jgi:hypothetical protein
MAFIGPISRGSIQALPYAVMRPRRAKGRRHLSVGRDEPDIAKKSKAKPDAGDRAIDSRDDRLWHAERVAEGLFEIATSGLRVRHVGKVVALHKRRLAEIAYIGPGAETAAGSGHTDDSHFGFVSGPQDRFLELDLHARRPRVELLGPIERNRRDPVDERSGPRWS